MNRSLLLTLLMMFAVSLSAQDAKLDKPTEGQLGKGDGKTTAVVTLKTLGSNELLKGFKVMVVGKTKDRESHKVTGFTDDHGKYRVKLLQSYEELRVFAFGEYIIPDAWSNIPIGRTELTTGNELLWDAFVRPLKQVKVTGKVELNNGLKAKRAYVYFAPLDVKPDGTRTVFESPYQAYVGDEGNYEQVLPSGYYQVWCTFSDRSTDVTKYFFALVHQFDLFSEQKLDLKLSLSPVVEGQVIDARTGKGIPARIDIYSNRYLKRLHEGTADGEFADEYGPDDKEIYWPVGTFKMSMHGLDPDNFMVVIKPVGMNNVIRTITGLSLNKLLGKKLVWELYSDESSKVEVTVLTRDGGLPVYDISVGFVPVAVDIPAHLKGEYGASGLANEDGLVKMMGLVPGTYDVFGQKLFLLGQIEVKASNEPQKFTVTLDVAFLTGQVKFEDGTVCKNLMCEVKLAGGNPFANYIKPWRKNKKLQEAGTLFLLLRPEVTFEIRFLAKKDGAKFEADDWKNHKDFELATDTVTIKIDDIKAYKVDLVLKANPEFRKREE